MRIRRRELRLGAAVLGVCGVALGLVFWMGSASQSSEATLGGSSEFQKSARVAPNQRFQAHFGETPEEAPAELWSDNVSSNDAGGEEAPAELWAEQPAPADNGPAELWAEPPFAASNARPQNGHGELWTEIAARSQDLPGQVQAPSDIGFKDMVKARAEEFSGGVDAAGMPLYKFNLWLNAPTDRAASVAKVAYRFEAQSATHTVLASTDRTQEFRVEFGAASCPKKVDVELTFTDGRTEAHQVDGCAILQ